jgi:hypothetical protein
MLKKPIFKNFTEYWYYARYLSREQRKIIFKSLSSDQRKFLDSSYLSDGWCDLFYRNEVNIKIDELKESYGYDILDIRLKALKGKSVYVPAKFWKIAEEQLDQIVPEAVNFAIGGLKAIPDRNNNQVYLIVYDPSDDSND